MQMEEKVNSVSSIHKLYSNKKNTRPSFLWAVAILIKFVPFEQSAAFATT